METNRSTDFSAESVNPNTAFDRVSALVDNGQGTTASRLMALQLVGGSFTTNDEWDRSRINLFICASPRTKMGVVFERIASTFGGVRWYNSAAIDGNELFFRKKRREEQIKPGVIFEDSTNVLYLIHPKNLRPSARTELKTVLSTQTYPVREDGVKTVLTPSAGIGLVEEPREGTWNLERSVARQISTPEGFTGGCDAILIVGHPETEDTTVGAEPLPQDVAYAYLKEISDITPEWTDEANQYSATVVDATTIQIGQIDDSNISDIMRLQCSDIRGSIRRFAEAHAKLRQSETVNKKDVEVIINLLTETWSHVGFELEHPIIENELSGTDDENSKKYNSGLATLPETTKKQSEPNSTGESTEQ